MNPSVFVLLVVFVDMLAYSTASPVIPPLVLGMTHGDGAASARAIGVFATAFSLMQFVFGPIQGAASDRWGRRPVLIVSCLGLAASQVTMAVAGTIDALLAGRIIAGVAAASVATATAYLADVTPPDQRPAAFGRIGLAIGTGLTVGPAVGGLLGEVSVRAPFWAAAAICAGNAAWAMFGVPESLPVERRSPFGWRRANPFAAIRFLLGRPALRPFAIANGLSVLAQQALVTIFILSAALRFGWGTSLLGLSLGTIGLCYALVGGFLVGPTVRTFGDRGAVGAGLAAGIAGFVLMAVAPTGWFYLLSVPLISLWSLSGPPIQAAMARHAGPELQGRLQGANTAVTGLAGIGGPAMFAGLLSVALARTHFPGLPFVLAAALLGLALPLALRAIGARATVPA